MTNTAKKATLVVIKDVINDNGGSLAAANFQLDVSGGTTEIAAFPGSETGTSFQVNAGTYTVIPGRKRWLRSELWRGLRISHTGSRRNQAAAPSPTTTRHRR